MSEKLKAKYTNHYKVSQINSSILIDEPIYKID